MNIIRIRLLKSSNYLDRLIAQRAINPPGGNFNNSKLAKLQHVLQSDFCNSIREVYEHVHETIDVQGNQDLRANATAKVLS